MTDALIGAELLARAVLAASRGVPEPVALAGYARQRWLLTAPMIPAVEHAASYRWSLASLQRAHLAMNARCAPNGATWILYRLVRTLLR